MASVESVLFSILTSGSPNPITALIGTRAYPDTLPQNPTYPAIRFQRISTPRAQYRTLDGRAEYASPRFQIDVFGLSKSQVLAVADAVYQRLEGYRDLMSSPRIDAISTDDEGSDFEPGVAAGGAGVYRQRLDVIIFHPE